MSKRKCKDEDSDDSEYISWKIKKLKKLLKRSRQNQNSSKRRDPTPTNMEEDPVDVLLDSLQAPQLVTGAPVEEALHRDFFMEIPLTATDPPAGNIELDKILEVDPIAITEKNIALKDSSTEGLDSELLEILKVDPVTVMDYGADIHKELASRLQHITTSGLTKEIRKELKERYLVPTNCVHIGAPLLNAEIKVAITETLLKRDKSIEARQIQLAAAISGLARILTEELENKNKDNVRLKQLMDVCRIMCDIQHAESVTRRNLVIYSIKKDLKDNLSNTKIDKYLFGENLAEPLKSAKAVPKSATELKTKPKAMTI